MEKAVGSHLCPEGNKEGSAGRSGRPGECGLQSQGYEEGTGEEPGRRKAHKWRVDSMDESHLPIAEATDKTPWSMVLRRKQVGIV